MIGGCNCSRLLTRLEPPPGGCPVHGRSSNLGEGTAIESLAEGPPSPSRSDTEAAGWTAAEYYAAPGLISDQHKRILDLQDRLESVEAERDRLAHALRELHEGACSPAYRPPHQEYRHWAIEVIEEALSGTDPVFPQAAKPEQLLPSTASTPRSQMNPDQSNFKAEFRPSAEHPDHWEVWHSRDDGESWTFARLEAKRKEPTDEQLERLTLTLGLPTLPPGLRPPHWRESMLNLHAMVQKAADGDPEANATLAHLRERFAA